MRYTISPADALDSIKSIMYKDVDGTQLRIPASQTINKITTYCFSTHPPKSSIACTRSKVCHHASNHRQHRALYQEPQAHHQPVHAAHPHCPNDPPLLRHWHLPYWRDHTRQITSHEPCKHHSPWYGKSHYADSHLPLNSWIDHGEYSRVNTGLQIPHLPRLPAAHRVHTSLPEMGILQSEFRPQYP